MSSKRWFKVEISKGGGSVAVYDDVNMRWTYIDHENCTTYTFYRTDCRIPHAVEGYCKLYECGTYIGTVLVDNLVYVTTAVFLDGPDFETEIANSELKPKDTNKCTCDIHTLMNVGCKCGFIIHERRAK